MNEKQLQEIEALLDVKPGFGIDWALDARKHLRYLLSEVRRLQAVVEEYADRGNWSPLDEHGMNSSEWLLEQEGWKRAEECLREDGEE